MSSIYVSSQIGQDTPENGSDPSRPLFTLEAAQARANPGDTVFVMPGQYDNPNNPGNPNPGNIIFTINKSGTPDAPITFQAFDPNNKPVIRVGAIRLGILIQGSHVILDGFEVVGNREQIATSQSPEEIDNYLATNGGVNAPLSSGYFGDGISVGGFEALTNHVTVRNSVIRDLPGGGITTVRTDFVTIENNQIYNTSAYTPYANSGVSIYQSRNSNNGSGGTMTVRGNTIYGNRNLVKNYINLQNGNSPGITDGNGIILDDNVRTQVLASADGQNARPLDLPAYNGRFIVENNLVFDNGGRGVNVFNSANAEIRNNTLSNNLQTPDFRNGRDGEISVIFDANGALKGAGLGISIGNNSITPAPSVPAEYVVGFEQGQETLRLTGSDSSDQITVPSLPPGQAYKFVQVYGKSGNDILTGTSTTAYNDLVGGDGEDTLISGAASWYNYLVGGRGNDALNLDPAGTVRDIIYYELGDDLDTATNFNRFDEVSFGNISAVDVVVNQGTNSTEFRVGDGIVGNSGFGSGNLMLITSGVTSFAPSDVGISLFGSQFAFS